jgi:hypothetical protein
MKTIHLVRRAAGSRARPRLARAHDWRLPTPGAAMRLPVVALAGSISPNRGRHCDAAWRRVCTLVSVAASCYALALISLGSAGMRCRRLFPLLAGLILGSVSQTDTWGGTCACNVTGGALSSVRTLSGG